MGKLLQCCTNAIFEFKDFPHFLKVFGTCVSYVTKESMFERIAYETLEDQASQNVLHSEIIFSAPQRVKRAGMDFGFMMKAYNKGISRAEKDFNVTCSTRIDLIRRTNRQQSQSKHRQYSQLSQR